MYILSCELSNEVLETVMNSDPMASLLAIASVENDGLLEGSVAVGAKDGDDDGQKEGSVVGLNVGARLGVFVGFKVGFSEGSNVGKALGLLVVHFNWYIELSLSDSLLSVTH